MPLNIEIRVDAPQAISTSNAVEQALGKVESAGVRAGDAATKAFGNSSTAAEKAKQSTESFTEQMARLANSSSAFTGFADQFKREADMLERINGPMREYTGSLQALDGLMMRGAITTDQYAEQVTRMNHAIDGTRTAAEEAVPASEKLGSIFETLALPAAGAGVLELGHKIAEVAGEMEKMEDDYTKLANKAQKFTDASQDANDVLASQQALAESLHSTIGPTIELYDKIREGTDELGLSQRQQLEMTRTIGQAVQEANKPLEEAGSIMQRFSYMLSSGEADVRGLKSVMVEVPAIGKMWAESFHTTEAGFLQMVKTHKIGINDIVGSFAAGGENIHADWNKMLETNEDRAKQYAERIKLLLGNEEDDLSEQQAVTLAGINDPNSFAAHIVKKGFGPESAKDTATATASLLAITDGLIHYRAATEAATAASRKLFDEFREGPALFKAVDNEIEHGAEVVGKLVEEWRRVGTLGKVAKELQDPWYHAADAIKGLSLAGEILNDLEAPQKKFDQQQAALNFLLDHGKISMDQYRDSMEKFINALPQEANHPSSVIADINFQLEHFNELMLAGSKIQPNYVLTRDPNGLLIDNSTRQATTTTGSLQFGHAANIDDAAPLPPSIKSVALASYEADVQGQRNKRSMDFLTTDWEAQLKKYEQQANEVNTAIAQGFKPVVDGITSMFETGSLNLDKIATDMEKVLTEMAVKFLLFEGLTGVGANAGVVKGLTGFATGGDVPYSGIAALPHAANGYAGKVGGVGGTDTRLFAAMVSPGETVSIRTPEQMAAQQPRAASGPTIINQLNNRGDLAAGFANGDHDTAILNVISRNARRVSGLLKK